VRCPAALCSCSLVLVAAAATPALAFGQEEGSAPQCAAPRGGGVEPHGAKPEYAEPEKPPCWVDVKPYPFGSFTGPSGIEEAGPVDVESAQWRAEHPQCVRGGLIPGSTQVALENQCYLTVTSIAFRSWNRGLAATTAATKLTSSTAAEKNPYGVWIYNGEQWSPDPTFPGRKVCPGHTIIWGGKLDYWLIGGPTDLNWSRLCRYNGLEHEWEPFSVPKATLQRITPPTIPAHSARGSNSPASTVVNLGHRLGGITSGACLAWNDCWFFGTYGAVVYWNGQALVDSSPAKTERWLAGEYLDAMASEDPLGSPFVMAVAGTAESARIQSELIPAQRNGAPPPELFRSVNGAFSLGAIGGFSSALPFVPPTHAQSHDPFRTDLVAVGLDAAGQGWVAGNPAGLRSNWEQALGCEPICSAFNRGFETSRSQPSPLIPVSSVGEKATCVSTTTTTTTNSGVATSATTTTTSPPATTTTSTAASPPATTTTTTTTTATATSGGEPPFPPEELSYTDNAATTSPAGAFLWSSLGVIPGSGDALAGGFIRPSAPEGSGGPNEGIGPEGSPPGEPVIVRASCDGQTTVTRFRTEEEFIPGQHEWMDATRDGAVTAIAANAENSGWAATSEGRVLGPVEKGSSPPAREHMLQPPHLYQLTDSLKPDAPEGNDEEARPLELEEFSPIFVFEPEPEEPAPPTPPPVTSTHAIKQRPAVYDVKAKLHRHGKAFVLYLSFKVRRPVTLGAEALRHGQVVSSARRRHFTGHTGVLMLPLNRKHWPTKVRFVT
jgi:hypothetical protein